jgi:hypothetical protein
VIREDTKDLVCEVRINFARELRSGEDIGMLRAAGGESSGVDGYRLVDRDG